MKVAGLDIGTTGCKCTVFDKNGKFVDRSYIDYKINRNYEKHTVDVEDICESVYKVISEMGAKYPDIEGIGVTSFGETFVMVDESGKILYRAMLYTDSRGAEECKELEEKIGSKKIAEITGLRPHEMYSISKIMWLKKNHPEIFAAAKHIFLIADYIVYCLTGKRQIDYSLASRTMAFDIKTLSWSDVVLNAAGIEKEMFSEPVPSGTFSGYMRSDVAEKCKLSKCVKVIIVGHDQFAAAVGAGAFDGNVAVDGAGTVECLTPVFDELPNMDVMYEGNFSVVPYLFPGKYIAYAFSYTGGALIQWCIDTLAKKEKEQAVIEQISVNELLEKNSHSPTGILVLPHFAGAATPYMDSGSKGAMIGLRMETTVSEIYRACMEAVVYEMYINLKFLEGSGAKFQKMYATGGGAKSREWMQMKADVLNIPITALKITDAGTVGCAMLTGIIIGIFKDLMEAQKCMVEEDETFYPRQSMQEKYKDTTKRYEKLYDLVRPLV